MISWKMGLAVATHEVEVRVGLLRDAGTGGPIARTGALVVDAGAYEAHRSALDELASAMIECPSQPLVIKAGESAKDSRRLPEFWTGLVQRELDRHSVLVVVGGGTLLDLGGFLAATYLRGIPFVSVPSTVLAQVDACLGGKNGVNLGGAKNQVGSFHHPLRILVDTELLKSNPVPVWRSGLGEVLKTALLAGGELFERVQAWPGALPNGEAFTGIQEVVSGCLRFKTKVVSGDEREQDRRRILNLGHTVGHVLESLALADDEEIPHGLAVAAGILSEARVLNPDPDVLEAIMVLMEHLRLEPLVRVPFGPRRARSLLVQDKKRRDQMLAVPLLTAPGSVEIKACDIDDVLRAVRAAVA